MTTLHYKEYQGAVEFEDGHLVIQVLHIDDSISATCDSAGASQAVFEELVDDYLATCQLVGKEPSKPFKGSFNVRIGSSLHRNAAMAAADAGETLNAWVASAIQQALSREQVFKVMKEYSLTQAFASATSNQIPQRYRYDGIVHTKERTVIVAGEVSSGGLERARIERALSGPVVDSPWSFARSH